MWYQSIVQNSGGVASKIRAGWRPKFRAGWHPKFGRGGVQNSGGVASKIRAGWRPTGWSRDFLLRRGPAGAGSVLLRRGRPTGGVASSFGGGRLEPGFRPTPGGKEAKLGPKMGPRSRVRLLLRPRRTQLTSNHSNATKACTKRGAKYATKACAKIGANIFILVSQRKTRIYFRTRFWPQHGAHPARILDATPPEFWTPTRPNFGRHPP